MENYFFFNRDLSWLTFNERVLDEAAKNTVPLMERVNFLSIFSSNLDEFYRVRMPVILALNRVNRIADLPETAVVSEEYIETAQHHIIHQQTKYGEIFTGSIIPLLKQQNVYVLFNEELPHIIANEVSNYFYSQVMAFLQPVELSDSKDFFPENNQLYFLINIGYNNGQEKTMVLNIPSDKLPRFLKIDTPQFNYIVFLDDVIRYNLGAIFKNGEIKGCYTFKVTRDAELDLKDEYPGDLSDQIEKQLLKRDLGIATRFLHAPGIPLRTQQLVSLNWNLQSSSLVEGGLYHNLKDLSSLPVNLPGTRYDKWPVVTANIAICKESIFSSIEKADVLVSTPYQSYNSILRFFNEAALDDCVEEIYITLYRVASDSRIVNALINAARVGKKVTVMVELKARFDEANNIKWAKKMKAAGVQILYSITALKVHAKVALIKRRVNGRIKYYGLLSTGNFNETTAAFYTDHILMTANRDILREVEMLFIFLARREKPASADLIKFDHLLVAQFNLQERFLEMIDREIANAIKGIPASITIKMNNLEEHILISKLYQASQAGVKVSLIVRSICCLIPGVKGMSENITVKRIVDRYLEHSRVFIFHNAGNPEVYMGSADWMNRNIYRRIEVCFPLYDEQIKAQITSMINLQLQDNVQAVMLNNKIDNVTINREGPETRSQLEIYKLLNN